MSSLELAASRQCSKSNKLSKHINIIIKITFSLECTSGIHKDSHELCMALADGRLRKLFGANYYTGG